ncbi:universal stress protein A-like protein [Aristolochia californica]|uniref:universal stress protein A-like protein n=1 Tax=Aristolochia californica TaxID=171875 RepID=UPI0035E2514C
MAGSSKKVIMVGLDDSTESLHSLEWTLDHVVTPVTVGYFRIVLLHVKVPALYVLRFTSSGMAAGDIITKVESDLNRSAAAVSKAATEACEKRSFKDFEIEMVNGDPREELCEAVIRHKAEILVVGSHGYGTFKRVVLGSVSDYCAHHAACSVLIVKKEKSRHQHGD